MSTGSARGGRSDTGSAGGSRKRANARSTSPGPPPADIPSARRPTTAATRWPSVAPGQRRRETDRPRLPRLLVGHPEHWATTPDTFVAVDRAGRGERMPTVAEGAFTATPVRLAEDVETLRRYGGAGIAVSEEQIHGAVRARAGRGL